VRSVAVGGQPWVLAAEWLWSQHQGHQTAKQLSDVYYRQLRHVGGYDTPVAEPRVDGVFGRNSYIGGAMALEAMRIAVGDATFFKIVRGWPVAGQFSNATTADFIAYADKVSGRSLDGFPHPWLYGTGIPPAPKPLGTP
jgi:aminopeptidase N